MKKSLIIFDLDGTLVDSFEAIQESLVHAMVSLGIEPWDLVTTKRHVGWGMESLLRDAVGEERIAEALRLFRAHYPTICLEKTHLLPDVPRALQDLDGAGFHMAVATNKPSTFSRAIVEHLGIGRYLPLVLGPNDVDHPKPHPAMLTAVMKRMGERPEETLYVGDMPLDVESGANAGVEVNLVATGTYGVEELTDLDLPVFASLPDLADNLLNKEVP